MSIDMGSMASGFVALQTQVTTIEDDTSPTLAALTVTGTVVFSGLPTEDPVSEGSLWNDSNTAAISPGA